jgi:hypothetical protein
MLINVGFCRTMSEDIEQLYTLTDSKKGAIRQCLKLTTAKYLHATQKSEVTDEKFSISTF